MEFSVTLLGGKTAIDILPRIADEAPEKIRAQIIELKRNKKTAIKEKIAKNG